MKRPPFRKIISRGILVSRGRGTYTHEQLECGHSYETTATGAARTRAKRRRCQQCLDRMQKDNA